MRTPLYLYHAKHAKITEFAGYEMPLFYKSAVQEAEAVRQSAGLFDVSHMGVIEVTGKDAESFLDFAATNQIAGKSDGSAIYTTLASESGGCIDDVMIMCLTKTRYLVITNAINKDKVLAHLSMIKQYFKKAALVPLFQKAGFLALQGKDAEKALIIPEAKTLKKHTLSSYFHPQFGELIIARTGYTGEDGFEILASFEYMLDMWNEILMRYRVQPCGLAARDILRLEMGYALYGHELTENISPIESVSHWTVKLEKARFFGKEALVNRSQKPHRIEQGILLQGDGVMREGFPILKDGKIIGKLTSGGYSPTLKKSIGIALLDEKQKNEDEVMVDIRGKHQLASITHMPFVKRG